MNEIEINEFIKKIIGAIIKLDGNLTVFLDEDIAALIGCPVEEFLLRVDFLKTSIPERFKFRATQEEYKQILSIRKSNLINMMMGHKMRDLAAFEQQYAGDPSVQDNILKEKEALEKERTDHIIKANQEILNLIMSKKEMPYLFTEIGLAMLCPFIRDPVAREKLQFLVDYLYNYKLNLIKDLTNRIDNIQFQNEIKNDISYIMEVLRAQDNKIKELLSLKESSRPIGKIGLIREEKQKNRIKTKDPVED